MYNNYTGVYTSSTDIDEVMPTISTIPHTSTITSVSITTSPSSSPPLNQQSGIELILNTCN